MKKKVMPPAEPQKPEEKVKKSSKEKADENKDETKKVIIDIEGIQNRILALPIPAGQYVNLQLRERRISILHGRYTWPRWIFPPYKLHKFTLKTRKNNVALPNLSSYQISFDKKKIIYNAGDSWYITDVGDNIATDKGKLNMDAIEVRIDPMAEWKQMFNEVWRINRDYFFDPGMQGADWPAIKLKYAQFLPYLSCRDDLNRIFTWMCSELSVGH